MFIAQDKSNWKKAAAAAMAMSLAASTAIATAGATPALADTGSFTITDTANTGATYKVYQVFTASIDNSNEASSVAWSTDTGIKAAVLNFLATGWLDSADNKSLYDKYLVSQDYITNAQLASAMDSSSADHAAAQAIVDAARENPQVALEYIASQISASTNDTASGFSPADKKAGTFADALAKALNSVTTNRSASAGTAFTADEGYYLFVTNTSSLSTGESGTAPMWVPLGGSSTSANAKSAVPTCIKQVKDDTESAYGKGADGNAGEDLDYRITGSLPSDIDAYSSYHVQFADTLESGKIQLKNNNTSSVVVKVAGVDVTSQITGTKGSIALSGNVLTVNIVDIRQLNLGSTPITSTSTVTVEYKAHLTTSATIGSTGNDNSVVMTYTNDPVSLGDGTTSPNQTKTYTFQLELTKLDKATGEQLNNAAFTIQVADDAANDANSRGHYINADGTIGGTNAAQAAVFTTANGKFTVPRIDDGKYIIHEVTPPSGYKVQAADVILTIASTINSTTGALTNLTATISGGDTSGTYQTQLNNTTGGAVNLTGDGTVQFQTVDSKEITLPITGMTRETGLVVLGLVIITGGAIWIVRSRKTANKDNK